MNESQLKNSSAPPPSKPKGDLIQTILEKLGTQLNQFTTEMKKLKDEHQTILAENLDLREKLSIFELNLAEFPSQTLSDFSIEIEGINTKLKIPNKAGLSFRFFPFPRRQGRPVAYLGTTVLLKINYFNFLEKFLYFDRNSLLSQPSNKLL